MLIATCRQDRWETSLKCMVFLGTVGAIPPELITVEVYCLIHILGYKVGEWVGGIVGRLLACMADSL